MTETHKYSSIISADSHVLEPMDLWWNALGHRLGDRTPRIISEYRGQKGSFCYTGGKNEEAFDNRDEDALVEAGEAGFAECGYDPAVRVRFQRENHIRAEVLNSTQMLGILRNPDVEVVQACAEVFNDWLAEFVSYDRERLVGISIIPMYDIDWSVKELERTIKMGLKGPMINGQAPVGCPPYRHQTYDRFWGVAEESDAPVTLHLLTGQLPSPQALRFTHPYEERQAGPGMWVSIYNEVQVVLANDFIFGGILDRFPTLNLICSEFEMAWVPGFMGRLDQMTSLVTPRLELPNPKMQPSDYMRTRIYHGLIDDPYGRFTIPLIGADRVLWGSDFPHVRSIGIGAEEHVTRLLETLSFEDQEKVVGGNAAKVFNIN
jgi:predicted TIM-barrel fold metal-dependent hydrolase